MDTIRTSVKQFEKQLINKYTSYDTSSNNNNNLYILLLILISKNNQ